MSKWVQVRACTELQAAVKKLRKAGYNVSALVRAFLIAKSKEV